MGEVLYVIGESNREVCRKIGLRENDFSNITNKWLRKTKIIGLLQKADINGGTKKLIKTFADYIRSRAKALNFSL